MELRAVAGPEGAPGARAQLAVVCLGEWAAQAAGSGPGSRRPRRARTGPSAPPSPRGRASGAGAGELGACWVAGLVGDPAAAPAPRGSERAMRGEAVRAGGGGRPGPPERRTKARPAAPSPPHPQEVSFFCR